MRWGIYALDGFEGAEAFSLGLFQIGEESAKRSAWDYAAGQVEPFDVVVVFGLHHRGAQIKADYEAAGVPVVVADYGYLKRTNHAHDWRTGHWQLSLGGLNCLPVGDVAAARFDALGLQIAGRGGNPDGYVLLCVQTVGDKSHGKDQAELQAWCDEQAARWPGLVIRPHPQEPENDYGLPVCAAKTLAEALDGACLVVTGNSNVGHDALLAGVPVVATFPGAAWAHLSGEQLPSIEARREHFQRCAYGQWTWNEFKRGLPQTDLLKRGFK